MENGKKISIDSKLMNKILELIEAHKLLRYQLKLGILYIQTPWFMLLYSLKTD